MTIGQRGSACSLHYVTVSRRCDHVTQNYISNKMTQPNCTQKTTEFMTLA